jgi:hypothetical protein
MGSNEQDFNNQAFVPYAINGGETTYVPNGKYDTLADCKDDGYVKPFLDVESNKNQKYHEYENPSEVAKRAGLNRAGSGPRHKKNELYGDTKKPRVRLPETPTTPSDGAESSPLVVATLSSPQEKSKSRRKCDFKTVIFVLLVLCLSAGGLALSVMNMLNKENCLCSRKGKSYIILDMFMPDALLFCIAVYMRVCDSTQYARSISTAYTQRSYKMRDVNCRTDIIVISR